MFDKIVAEHLKYIIKLELDKGFIEQLLLEVIPVGHPVQMNLSCLGHPSLRPTPAN